MQEQQHHDAPNGLKRMVELYNKLCEDADTLADAEEEAIKTYAQRWLRQELRKAFKERRSCNYLMTNLKDREFLIRGR